MSEDLEKRVAELESRVVKLMELLAAVFMVLEGSARVVRVADVDTGSKDVLN